MSEGARYSLILDGQQITVSWDELVQMTRDGRLTPVNIVTMESGAQVPAQDVPGLFEVAPSLPPVAPPVGTSYYASQSSAPPKRGFPVWAIILIAVLGTGGGCCIVLAAILFPVFSQAKVAALRAAELAHMKQLALGTIMYSSDWDDRFPPSTASAAAVKPYIFSYVKDPVVFVELNPAGGQILGDNRLKEIEPDTLMNPVAVVMFYNERDWSGGVVLASYADGHGERGTRAEVDADLAAPLKLGKPVSESDLGTDHPSTPPKSPPKVKRA